MSFNSVNKKIKKIVAEILEMNSCELSDNAIFTKEYGADSITVIEILAAIESEFEIKLPENFADKMISLNSIYTVMQEISISYPEENS
ncbi:acyl carrier protein [Xenorhabdus bovienii]|uniref:acyl carrier protein n=1 Tax=Xenorhabdus bovienii TaxID=40576 RepID=UPI003DA6650B